MLNDRLAFGADAPAGVAHIAQRDAWSDLQRAIEIGAHGIAAIGRIKRGAIAAERK